MGDLLYSFVSAGLQAFIWGGDIIDEEFLPERGPAILVSNHLDALGQIAVVAGIPRRLYPWIAAEMLDPQRAAEYLRLDFVEKEFGLRMPASLWLAKALSKVTIPLLRSAGCVPVYSEAEELHTTFEHSLDLLLGGHLLLIFPEDPVRPLDPRFNMRPFKKGFIRLAELYFQRTSGAIRFHPIAVYAQRNLIQVGKPVRYNPYASPAGERLRIKSLLESMIHELYLELGGNPYMGIPLPHLETMTQNNVSFWAGVRAELPLLIGVFPFGMIYGALALNAGLSTTAAQLMSSIVFAGSSQFVAAQLFHEAAPALVIVLTIAVVNLRHMLYSASLAPYLKHLSLRWKVLLSYLLTDEAYAPTILKYEKEGIDPSSHWFLLGAGFSLWFTWQASTALGIFLGTAIPEEWPLDFALPLTFIAMLVPALKNRPMIAAALSAGMIALLAYNLPFKLGLILAAFTGILVGTVLEGRQ